MRYVPRGKLRMIKAIGVPRAAGELEGMNPTNH